MLISLTDQNNLMSLVRDVVREAPLYHATLHGRNFKYVQSGAGYGWTSGHGGGYRYQDTHPITGKKLPVIPKEFLEIASQYGCEADAMLINYYTSSSTLSLHQDKDEKDLTVPVVSISFGDTAVFSHGPTYHDQKIINLISGSVFVFDKLTRMHWHGVKSIIPNTGPVGLVRSGGRVNVTLRKSQ